MYSDRDAVLRRAAEAGVLPIIVTNRPSEYRNLRSVLGESHHATLGLGLHPEAAGSVYEHHELAILKDFFHEAEWIAEIGLDGVLANSVSSYFGGRPTLECQQRLLEEILALGLTHKLLTVHSRGAEDLLLDMLRGAQARSVILHWYHGSRETARGALDLGFYFSINQAMLDDESGHAFACWLPLDAVLLETDGPFTTTHERRAEPQDVLYIAEQLAAARGVDRDDLLQQTMKNFAAFKGHQGAVSVGA
jgi:TatD DNase family protein